MFIVPFLYGVVIMFLASDIENIIFWTILFETLSLILHGIAIIHLFRRSGSPIYLMYAMTSLH